LREQLLSSVLGILQNAIGQDAEIKSGHQADGEREA
jgi:hypothetical protein